jgi:hypothetical protein
MAAASTVVQAVSAPPGGRLTAGAVLSKAVDMVGSAPYRAPNGSFGFSPSGELQNPAIPVYADENGTCLSS